MRSAFSRASLLLLFPQRTESFALRFLCAVPSRPLRCGFSLDQPVPIVQLRARLSQQLRDKVPRMQSIDTSARLAMRLSQSPRPSDRREALQLGASLWTELSETASPIPMTSQTGMRMALCAAMRRCALLTDEREAAEVWTERFARRHRIGPDDFTTGGDYEEGAVLGWRHAKPRPGTGIDEDDLAADAAEEEQEKGKNKSARGERTPMQQMRHDVFMDHPMMQRAFGKGTPPPGPRYTG